MGPMTNLALALKQEISRLARKEARAEVAALKKASTQQRAHIASLRKALDGVLRTVSKLQRTRASVAPAPDHSESEDATSRRWSAARFAKHRERLKLSAAEMAQLIGVSGQSIYKWEHGEARPRKGQLEAIASVRALGPREARARLVAMQESKSATAKAPRKTRKVRRTAKKAPARKAA